jgi:VWFA-related protein
MCCALLPAFAQDPPEVRIRSAAWFPPSLTISADANLVELGATVRDRQGQLVGGLHASDFEVLDDKQPREIKFFSELRAGGAVSSTGAAGPSSAAAAPAIPEPRTIALFFDDVHASVLGVHKSAEAAGTLIENELHPGDRAGIFTSSGTTSVDFTGDRDHLMAALARLQPHPLNGAHVVSSPPMTPFQAYTIIRHLDPDAEGALMLELAKQTCSFPLTAACMATQRSAAVSAAMMVWEGSQYQYTTTLDAMGIVLRHLAAEPGKRILILMSPGFPTGGMEKRTSALVDAALRANIRIGAVNSEGLPPFPGQLHRMVVGEFMTAAAKSTGGQYVDLSNDWAGSLRTVTADPEVSYVLGFSPPADPDGHYHALKTRIGGNQGYTVESRTGYIAAKAGETAQRHIDRVAMSDSEIKDFPATVTVRQDQDGLHVNIAVEAKALRFPEMEGRRVEELTFLTVLEDAQGNFVAGKQSIIDMALTPATLAEKVRKGIQAATSFPVPRPGSYRVREVIREAAQDRMWASTATVSAW